MSGVSRAEVKAKLIKGRISTDALRSFEEEGVRVDVP